MPKYRLTWALCTILLFTPNLLWGQSTNATITGQVADPTKAILPQATVRAINNNTNVRYETKSNSSGAYVLSSLPPGDYRLEVEKTGFRTIIKPDIILHVQDTIELNFEMAVGSASETVTVTGGAPLVDTSDGSVSTVVGPNFVENIPLNGRSFQTLISLTPGVVLTATNFAEQGQFSVNGQRANSNYFSVDGISANVGVSAGIGLVQSAGGSLPALNASGGTTSLVSVDAMQEFRVQTSTFAPEFGRTPGAQISIVTRSGTNQFHGTLFEYFRNDVLDASDWFNGTTTPPRLKAQERQNDFGGTLGGPVLKNRTFFFFSYEGLRLRQPRSQATTVPSIASRTSALAAVQPLLNAYPLPNGQALPSDLAPFTASYSDALSTDATSIRIDHNVKSKLTLFGRYSYSPSEALTRGPAVLSNVTAIPINTQTLTFGTSYAVSPAVTDEFRGNYSTQTGGSSSSLDGFGGAVPFTLASVLPAGTQPQDSFFSPGIIGAGSIFLGKNVKNEERQVNVVDNLSLTLGSHQLKIGVDYRRLGAISGPRSYDQIVIFLGVDGFFGATAGRALLAQVDARQRAALITNNFSSYVQDTWRANPRLTLTYGLRWDINPAPHGHHGLQPAAVQGIDSPATLSLSSFGTPLYATTYSNIAPRIGVAYKLSEATGKEIVLRGGWGIFYDLGSGSLGSLTSAFPFVSTRTLPAVAYPLTGAQAAPPTFNQNPPFGTVLAVDPRLTLPRTYQWNLAIEQSLGANQSMSATYVAAVGRDLLRQESYEQPNPDFSSNVTITTNSATSDYHALQLQYKRRLVHGLQALVSYTWSHSIDTASVDSTPFVPGTVASAALDRASSDFDIRHSLAASGSYQLPAPHIGSAGNALFGGWSLDALIIARSAPPVDLVGSFNTTGFFGNVRPDVVPNIPFYLFGPTFPGGKGFNPAAFVAPVPGKQGTFGRNILRGFGAWQTNLALRRDVHLWEKLNLQFRAEFFNLFNHPNFGPPNGTFGSAQFGKSTQMLGQSMGAGGNNGGLSPLYQIGGPRSMQFALRLSF